MSLLPVGIIFLFFLLALCLLQGNFAKEYNMFTSVPEGVVTYMRRRVPSKCFPIWLESRTRLRPRIHIDSEGLIEVQGHGLIQIDFANKYGLPIIIQGVLLVIKLIVTSQVLVTGMLRSLSGFWREC